MNSSAGFNGKMNKQQKNRQHPLQFASTGLQIKPEAETSYIVNTCFQQQYGVPEQLSSSSSLKQYESPEIFRSHSVSSSSSSTSSSIYPNQNFQAEQASNILINKHPEELMNRQACSNAYKDQNQSQQQGDHLGKESSSNEVIQNQNLNIFPEQSVKQNQIIYQNNNTNNNNNNRNMNNNNYNNNLAFPGISQFQMLPHSNYQNTNGRVQFEMAQGQNTFQFQSWPSSQQYYEQNTFNMYQFPINSKNQQQYSQNQISSIQNVSHPFLNGWVQNGGGYPAKKENNEQRIETCNNVQIYDEVRPELAEQLDENNMLQILRFKVHLCQKKEAHEKKKCPFYHSDNDRRRCPTQFKYSFNECKKRDKCDLSDDCPQGHNKVEQLYHPLRYKAKFCQSYLKNNQFCEYERFCSFAHDESEIIVPLIQKLEQNPLFYMYFYKTVWCPNTSKHERADCPYMHNVQDFRRDPKFFKLEPKQCENWKKCNLQTYSEGECSNSLECKNCHGWKELGYHPMVYKTKACSGTCSKTLECVNYHSPSDQRIITPELLQQEEQKAKELLNTLAKNNYGQNQNKQIYQRTRNNQNHTVQSQESYQSSSLIPNGQGKDSKQQQNYQQQQHNSSHHHKQTNQNQPSQQQQQQKYIYKPQQSRLQQGKLQPQDRNQKSSPQSATIAPGCINKPTTPSTYTPFTENNTKYGNFKNNFIPHEQVDTYQPQQDQTIEEIQANNMIEQAFSKTSIGQNYNCLYGQDSNDNRVSKIQEHFIQSGSFEKHSSDNLSQAHSISNFSRESSAGKHDGYPRKQSSSILSQPQESLFAFAQSGKGFSGIDQNLAQKNFSSELYQAFDRKKQSQLYDLLIANRITEDRIKKLTPIEIQNLTFMTNSQQYLLNEILSSFLDDQELQNICFNINKKSNRIISNFKPSLTFWQFCEQIICQGSFNAKLT